MNDKKNNNKSLYIILSVFLFIISVSSAFVGGYYLNGILIQSSTSPPNENPPEIEEILPEEEIIDETSTKSGLQYISDTIIAITDETPKKILVATAARQEKENDARQSSRISFFDGENWDRKILTENFNSTEIHSNKLINQWKITIDPSRVLKQEVTGLFVFENNLIGFDTNVIDNNISVRSLPGYTKFMSNGEGVLSINGSQHTAKILYTRIYSSNSQEIQFYSTPFGLTTYWIAFWDENGNFYHIDSTQVSNPTEKYQTHHFAALVDSSKTVTKSFDVNVISGKEKPPSSYEVELGYPVNKTLKLDAHQSLDKAPGGAYSWYMSNTTGVVNGVQGFGLIEYINN